MLKLFYAPGACSLASHIALEEAGVDYEIARLDLAKGDQAKPEYKAVNPKGKVPALATDRGVLTENPAILAYIAQSYPAAALAPTDPFAFAEFQAFNMWLSSSVHVIFGHAFRPGRWADGDEAAAAIKAKVPHSLEEQFAQVEDRLADGRPWVHGEAFTASDGYLLVFSRWFARDGMGDWRRFERVSAHRERVQARPAVRKVLAEEGLAPV